jgi:dTDP-4-dehydrorhamnose 3,5-epimerase
MNIIQTPIDGLLVLQPKVHGDARGWFMESYTQRVFEQAVGQPVNFVQDNHSFSRRGVLRGLHYQMPPHAQAKLVRVPRGAAWDVAVDIRRSSPTFGQWFGVELTEQNNLQLWIPQGFAHGFVVLSDTADFLYKTTAYYAPEADRVIQWNDADLKVGWPVDSVDANGVALSELIQISAKDSKGIAFKQAEVFD